MIAPNPQSFMDVTMTSLAHALELFVRHYELGGDVIKVRRSLEDARKAHPGDASDSWTHWLTNSCEQLGLSARSIQCAPSDLSRLSAGQMSFVARMPTGVWVVCVNGKVERLNNPANVAHARGTQLEDEIPQETSTSDPEQIPCVLVEARYIPNHDHGHHPAPLVRLWSWLKSDRTDLWIILVYSLASGLLSLATPLAVEALVNTVAFGRLLTPVIVLAGILFGFLAFSAVMKIMQTYVVEVLQQRLFVRIAADLSLRLSRVRHQELNAAEGRELVNRFLDVAIAQKTLATLLSDGVSLLISVLVGMTVLAFYHPWLLSFDIVLVATLVVVTFVLGRGAIGTALIESRAKYKVTAWLEDVASCRTTWRTSGATQFALARTDDLVHEYLTARGNHFSILMRQIIFALTAYALASTALLGLGGWLVISGQLSLGQLVAAELIIAVIVGAFTKLGKHLESFYDLMGAVDKLGHLLDLPLENQGGSLGLPADAEMTLSLHGVACTPGTGHHDASTLSHLFPPGTHWSVLDRASAGQSSLGDLIYGLKAPAKGFVSINRISLRDLSTEDLRRCVTLARDGEIFSGSIIENVHLGRPHVSSAAVHDALETVGLSEDFLSLPTGLATPLTSGGGTLAASQRSLLMIARAIAGSPRILVIDGLLDVLPEEVAEGLVERLRSPDPSRTLIVITARDSVMNMFSNRLRIDHTAVQTDLLRSSISESSHD
jgi:putative ABC transport system ATP-binding protein